MVKSEDRIVAMLIYAISYFTAFVGPLVLWVLFKGRSDFVDFHGRQYLNLLISFTFYMIISYILMIVGVGFLLVAIVPLISLALVIIAGVKAFFGEYYRVPGIFRLIRQ